jgi:hypothetical protein
VIICGHEPSNCPHFAQVLRGLIEAAVAAGREVVFDAENVQLHDLDTDQPHVTFRRERDEEEGWTPHQRTLVSHHSLRMVHLWSPEAGRLRCRLVALPNNQGLAVSPDGHYAGTPRVEQELIYVVRTEDAQEVLNPQEFAQKYGWSNDPGRVQEQQPVEAK